MKTASIYLHGMPGPSQRKDGIEVLREDAETVTLANDYAESGEATYRRSDGRYLDANGRPHSWDFWRLCAEDRNDQGDVT